MRRSNGIKFLAVIVVIGILACVAGYGIPALGINDVRNMRFGIDIKGGISTTLYPDLPEGQRPTAEELASARAVIERRLDSQGIYDRNITTENENGRIVVEIPYKPGEKDFNPQKAVDEIGKTALLTFQEVDENLVDENKLYKPTNKIVIEGKHVSDAGIATDPQTGEVVVTLKLNGEGKTKFSEATGRLIGKRIAIFMDDTLIVAPTVQSQIPDGEATINGQRDAKEAGELAATIRSGSLPFKLVARDLNSITPTLGEGALKVTIMAGILAFILVALFMILYYRLPGVIACIALFGLVVIQMVVLSLFKISLTLPGIAGIILSIGMGVDANVIIFERIKEELRSGKTLGASVDSGFKRAFSAILDSNVTTIISAVVLYFLGTGAIKGFAVTLFLGVLLSFFTAVTASRIMLRAAADINIAKHRWLYGS
ncbi:preprotein translocase subunit SecD [Anaerobacterium chartisolvens]|uniref:Protein translocase subunit SecD n=1 Tax=Anaerobacterium chartisolvens TaxID=1297424 RepID=A0A369B288_9FIRM|nr:protein translocase subunit SecD [Anaerobacterium chartisolvens]RCX13824.1 preprotein translocase subunit SecD [Anaerobacterium chartisolvens]